MYLKGTTNIGLIYHGDTSYDLACYLDSDFVVNLDVKRSVTGYAFTIGNTLASWKATFQPTLDLSTTKAQYMALEEALKEGI